MLAAALAAGCGGGAKPLPGDRIPGDKLTIYSSAPLTGPSSSGATAVLDGERLALAQVHGRIGRYRIVLNSLDDSTPGRSGWDPGQTTNDAHVAQADPTTIGYLGEFNSGASAVSIPLLNRLGIPQISAASSAVGLTSDGAGASPGEPQKYYPTGKRTFARVIPDDVVQATAQVRTQQSLGCRSTFVLDDGGVDGFDGATTFQAVAHADRLPVAGVQAFDPKATDYSSLAATVAGSGADCVLISADPEGHEVLLTEQVAQALPHASIFATAGMAQPSYTSPEQGGLPLALDGRVLITAPVTDAAGASTFYTEYERQFGTPGPYAIYGYEAMSLMLDAIARATGHGRHPALRSKVLAAIFATRGRRSVLGTYGIDRDGDTTLGRYGVYRVVNGGVELSRVVNAGS